MKIKMQKITFAFVALLLLGILMGCTGQPDTPAPTPPPPSKELVPVGNGKTAPANSIPAQDFKDGKG
jgi:hypothetical protein